MVAFFFFLHPFLCSEFSPGRNCTEYYIFPDGKREIFNKFARKIIALMTSLDALSSCARPDRTGSTIYE
jgi:hypothetical protein